MGHIPYPLPQQSSSYEQRELREGDIVRIEHPERMSEKPPEQLIGEPLEVKNINYEQSIVTIGYNGDDLTIPLRHASLSARTPKEFVEDVIEYFKN